MKLLKFISAFTFVMISPLFCGMIGVMYTCLEILRLSRAQTGVVFIIFTLIWFGIWSVFFEDGKKLGDWVGLE